MNPDTIIRWPLDDAAARERLRAELDSWIGTPWHHCATAAGRHNAIKGIRGDCVHIIVAAFENAGLVAPLNLPAHGAQHGMASEKEAPASMAKFLAGLVESQILERVPIEDLRFGDIITFKTAGREHHLGVYIGGKDREFYHAGAIGRNGAKQFGVGSLLDSQAQLSLQRSYRIARATS